MAGGYPIGLWALLITAAVCDLIWGKVYNWVNGSFLLTGLLTHLYWSGPSGVTLPCLGIVTAFCAFFPLYWIKAFAAGDVKLLMAIGAWTDPKTVLELGAIAIVVGAVIGTIILIRKRGLRGSLQSLQIHLSSTSPKESLRIAFAPAFLAAIFIIKIWERHQ